MTLRVAFPYKKDVSFYEPTRIHFAPEYVFLENIYSPLIELDSKEGTPSSGIAVSYDWIDNKLHLYIQKNLTTIDGYKITAYDAEFSLKRLMILASNTHGNIKSILCPDEILTNIESVCKGIEVVDEYHLILKVEGQKQFLAKMIATIDFSVIPISSVDPKTLKIIDYRNTSGPYYVHKNDGQGNIILKVNPSHYHYKKNIPQEIKIIPSLLEEGVSSLQLFKSNKVDHITTIDDLKVDKVIKFSKDNDNSFLHSTMPLRTFAIFFTEKGLKKFSVKERISLGKNIRRSLQETFLTRVGFEKRHQFFPQFGDGGLSDSEMQEVDAVFNSNTTVVTKKVLLTTIRVGKSSEFNDALSKFTNITVMKGDVSNVFGGDLSSEKFPDMFIASSDVSFMEDVGLISYTVNAGLIGIEKDNREEWLKKYMEVEDKSERMQLLKAVHKKALLNAYLVPYASSPYVAILRKAWKSDLPEIVGNNLLWKITKD